MDCLVRIGKHLLLLLAPRWVAAMSWKQPELFLSSISVEPSSPYCQFWLHLLGFLGFSCLPSSLQKDVCLDSNWSLAFSPLHIHPPERPRATTLPTMTQQKGTWFLLLADTILFLFFSLCYYLLDQRIIFYSQTSVLQTSLCPRLKSTPLSKISRSEIFSFFVIETTMKVFRGTFQLYL